MRPPTKPQKRFLAKDGPTPAEQKWRPLIKEWSHSGLRISAFCRQRGIPDSAFTYWKRQIPLRDQQRQADRAASEASRNAMQFLPVRVLESESGASGSLEVVLRGGRLLRVGGDFDPAILEKLVATLEGAR